MYKPDLALNNLQWLISHKTKPNQTSLYLQSFSYMWHKAGCMGHPVKFELTIAQSAGAVEYTDYNYAEGQALPPMSVLI